MRSYSVVGLVLIVLGVVVLSVRSITYFSTEQVSGPLGYFAWDITKPHTIFINPIAGLLAIAIGVGLVVMQRRRITS
jgi:hypothetical protein